MSTKYTKLKRPFPFKAALREPIQALGLHSLDAVWGEIEGGEWLTQLVELQGTRTGTP